MIEDPAMIEEFKRLTREALTHDESRGVLAGIVDGLVGILEKVADFQVDRRLDVRLAKTRSRRARARSSSPVPREKRSRLENGPW